MTWGRIDDHLDDDPRVLAASPAEAGVFFLTLPRALRCNSPVIPAGVVARFSESERVIAIGLWERRDDGSIAVAADLWRLVVCPDDLREKRRQAAHARWSHRQSTSNAHAVQEHSASNAEPVPDMSPNGDSPQTPQGVGGDGTLDAFVATWNDGCVPLPKLRHAPTAAPKQRLIRSAVAYFDGDGKALLAAIRRCAADPHYRENHYTFEQFCRHVERWGEPSGEAPLPENPVDRRIRESTDAFARLMAQRNGNGVVIDMPSVSA